MKVSTSGFAWRAQPCSDRDWDDALQVLLVATGRSPTRSNPTGRINAWKASLNALTIHYGDRIQAAG
jgi:hypothetical protein